ncbi:hypothetical protein OEW28_06905 [Defluviimonas sp. WL0002]|uniref:Dihydrodipicolinate reductase n=1 Tax=Albidovulum marisflavi TaxID=2984159 RepID=A0ABT2ZB30_9RHOB|nr:hypothetical protein [Defluviimonas sp. WL0002]MCV2868355.1 hypothetical protein [Defluviimonas sp. WL0002]
MKRALIAILLLTATDASAQEEWIRLRHGELNNAIVAERLRLEDGAEQSFGEDGFTRHAADVSRRGYWKIDGDKLCTAWPPAGDWTCYRLYLSGDRKRLRFKADDGSTMVGTYLAR